MLHYVLSIASRMEGVISRKKRALPANVKVVLALYRAESHFGDTILELA